MKRLGMLLVLLSVGMFTLGCTGEKKDTKKTGGTEPAKTTPAETGTTTPPAETK